jgi:hypothetical protein
MDDEKETFTHFPRVGSAVRRFRELLSALRLVVVDVATYLNDAGIGPYVLLLRSVLRELDERMDDLEGELELAERTAEFALQGWTVQLERLQHENRQLRARQRAAELPEKVKEALKEPVPDEVLFYRHAYRDLPAGTTAENAPSTGYEKIRAIKVARERFDMGLADAKMYVEQIPVQQTLLETALGIVAKFDEIYAKISLDPADYPGHVLDQARRAATWDKLVDLWLARP